MFGPGVERTGLKAHEPTHFTVDCTEAGEGKDTHAFICMHMAFYALFKHLYHLNGLSHAVGDVSVGIKCDANVISDKEEDVDFDIITNANDTITVKYIPPGAGRLTIKVLFTDQVSERLDYGFQITSGTGIGLCVFLWYNVGNSCESVPCQSGSFT